MMRSYGNRAWRRPRGLHGAVGVVKGSGASNNSPWDSSERTLGREKEEKFIIYMLSIDNKFIKITKHF